MRGIGVKRERGYVAAILLVLVTLGALAGLLNELNASTSARPVDTESGSGTLLGDVRDALTTWSANHPDRPGGLPCPDSNGDGLAEATCDTEASRLGLVPWQTLGLAVRPVADGEPLWYAVGAGYRVQTVYADPDFAINIASTDVANADRRPIQTMRPGATGALLANDVAAVILVPGPPLAGQTRPAGAVDVVNPSRYFEGRNASVSDGDRFDIGDYNTTFNDRVVMLRAQELFDVVEPAIEQRLRSVAFWNELRRHNHPASQDATFPCSPAPCESMRYMPYAVPFTNPMITPFKELTWTQDRGLMPVGLRSTDLAWSNFTRSHVSGPGGGSNVTFAAQPNGDVIITLIGPGSPVAAVTYDVSADVVNAGRGFLQSLALPAITVGGTVTAVTGPTVTMNPPSTSQGTLRMSFRVSFVKGPNTAVTLAAPKLNPAFSNETPLAFGQPTAWFMRNQWYRFVFYVTAYDSLPGGSGAWVSGPASTPAWTCLSTCLSVTYPVSGSPTRTKDIALVYMGRALASQDRTTPGPANLVTNYLDTTENTNLDLVFEQRVVRNAANDRVAYDPRP